MSSLGLVPALLKETDFIRKVPIEQILDAEEQAIVSMMQSLLGMGVVPTKSNMLEELASTPELKTEFLKMLANDPEHDLSYVLANIRKEYNEQTLFNGLSQSLTALRDEGVDEALEVFESSRKKLASSSTATGMDDAARSAIGRLRMIYEGHVKPSWQTGFSKFDSQVGLDQRKLIMIAAQAKIGKTRFTSALINGLIKRQPDISVDWYTFEMHPDEVIILLIAMLTGIDTRIIEGKMGKPDESVIKLILNAEEIIRSLPIRWFNTPCTVEDIGRNTESMLGKKRLVVVDNIGLVKDDKGRDELSLDKHLSSSFVQMRDQTDALILVLHHLSKTSEGHLNKSDFYEPQVTHIRGSNKWVDSVNGLIMLHRIDAYKQLEKMMTPEQWQRAQGKMFLKVPAMRGAPAFELKLEASLGLCRFSEI